MQYMLHKFSDFSPIELLLFSILLYKYNLLSAHLEKTKAYKFVQFANSFMRISGTLWCTTEPVLTKL